jgi:hypothetical protein
MYCYPYGARRMTRAVSALPCHRARLGAVAAVAFPVTFSKAIHHCPVSDVRPALGSATVLAAGPPGGLASMVASLPHRFFPHKECR